MNLIKSIIIELLVFIGLFNQIKAGALIGKQLMIPNFLNDHFTLSEENRTDFGGELPREVIQEGILSYLNSIDVAMLASSSRFFQEETLDYKLDVMLEKYYDFFGENSYMIKFDQFEEMGENLETGLELMKYLEKMFCFTNWYIYKILPIFHEDYIQPDFLGFITSGNEKRNLVNLISFTPAPIIARQLAQSTFEGLQFLVEKDNITFPEVRKHWLIPYSELLMFITPNGYKKWEDRTFQDKIIICAYLFTKSGFYQTEYQNDADGIPIVSLMREVIDVNEDLEKFQVELKKFLWNTLVEYRGNSPLIHILSRTPIVRIVYYWDTRSLPMIFEAIKKLNSPKIEL